MMRIQHKVEFFYSGRMFSESSSEDITHRDPYKVEVPKSAFCFQLYDLESQDVKLEDGRYIEHREITNKSPLYYPGGRIMTIEDVESEVEDNSILLSNMRSRGGKVIKTRQGGFQPFENEKTVII